ncbi:MAG TPA: carboxypeptidase-like regulatory domain-containing protein [Terracidiphilus sp.]|nr:carboxypeptidase-like regulatory domain-containing protein [Terracidiphilus sp.]
MVESIAPASLSAQGITGSITGTVSDPSGAVIGGANVTVRQEETNAIRMVVTSDAGTYTVTQLQPGHYAIKVEKAGFKAQEQRGITLVIDQSALINIQLTVGSQSENVEVTSTGPVIQTEDSSVGQVIDAQAIQNTPLNGRLSVMGLIALAPGMQGVGAQDQMATRGLTFAAGTGSRNAYGGLGVSFDGVVNKEVTLQRGEPEIPSLDALSQFKVLANGAAAEFNEPTQVIVVSSSGTNAFHGELFEFNRSKGTAAKTYSFTTPATTPARPPYERNEFGGNLAGPIWIPKLYNGKDRSFFFFAYEGFRLTQSSPKSTQQPTAKMRSGDFSEFLDSGGNCPKNSAYFCIFNPATGTKFAGNIIPSGLNTVSVALMNKLMPTPTTSGTGTNTFENVPYNSNVERISLRADHRFNDSNSIRFTWLRAFYGPNVTVGPDSLQGGVSGDGEHNSQFILGYTHTFSPTLVMDLNGDFFHLPIYRTPQNVNTKWESIIPGLSTQLIEGAPQITISNIQSISEAGSKDLEQVGQLNGSLTKVLARHTLKFGGSYLYDNHWNIGAQAPQRGSFAFGGQYTKNAADTTENTGIAFADFLLGLPTTSGQATPAFLATRNISSQWAGFFQDDWKPFAKLTVNAGIRYDLQWFQPGPYNQNALWNPALNKVVVFGNSYPSAAIPQYLTLLQTNNLVTLSSSAGISNNPFAYLTRPSKDIAPRLGFAYQLERNTVLRGAFGIYFNLLPASYMGSMFGQLPFTASLTFTNTPTYNPATTSTMNNPFAGTGNAGGRPGINAEHPLVTPYTEEYNLTLEHQFPHAFDVRVGYVGQHNLKQNNASGPGTYAPNLNYADPFDITKSAAAQAPFPVLGTIGYQVDPLFHSNMNSLQLGAHKQYTNGIAFGAEYQWTHVLGTENLQDPSGKYPQDSFGNIGGITPQVLQLSYSYALPFGKGKSFFPNSGSFANKVIGGWEISGVVDAQSGQPFSASYTATPSSQYPGLVSGRASRAPGIALYPSKKTRTQWFNPAAFTAPTNAAGVAGGAYGNSGYNMLYGPRYQSWDMNLKKNVPWGDHYTIQLRADAFNIFNHPNFNTPNANISNSNVGTVTGISGTPSYEARTMEFAVKFNF